MLVAPILANLLLNLGILIATSPLMDISPSSFKCLLATCDLLALKS